MNTITKKRIRVYINVRQNIELARKIYEKHMAEGKDSLLSSIDGFSWDATGPKIGFCLEKHKEASQLNKSAEEMYRQRDSVLAEITDIIQATKLLLKNKYSLSPEELHEWGFEDYSSIPAREKVPP